MSKGKNSGAATKKVAVPQSLEEALTLIETANKSIEELEATNEELEGKLEVANQANEELEGKLEALKNSGKNSSEQDEIIAELNKQIGNLEAKIEEYKTGVPVLPEVTIDGKVYQVNNGGLFENKKYTREELANNVKVCEKLLDIDGQTTITLKEEGE